MQSKSFSSLLILLFISTVIFGQEPSKKATTPNTFTDSRDGEVYKTIKIGNQLWMAENLRYKAKGSYLNPENPNKSYGRLYDWTTLMGISKKYVKKHFEIEGEQHQGICPNGWHIPSDKEWMKLEIALGAPEKDVKDISHRGKHATSMKTTTGWKEHGNGTNSSGFSLLPAGEFSFKKFSGLGSSAYFWTTSDATTGTYNYGPKKAYYRKIYLGPNIFRETMTKESALSCRCIKD